MPRNERDDRAGEESGGTPVEEMSFEEAVAELESIIDRIEQGEIGLEQSLAQRRRGDALVKRCREILDHAEQEIQQLKPEQE